MRDAASNVGKTHGSKGCSDDHDPTFDAIDNWPAGALRGAAIAQQNNPAGDSTAKGATQSVGNAGKSTGPAAASSNPSISASGDVKSTNTTRQVAPPPGFLRKSNLGKIATCRQAAPPPPRKPATTNGRLPMPLRCWVPPVRVKPDARSPLGRRFRLWPTLGTYRASWPRRSISFPALYWWLGWSGR